MFPTNVPYSIYNSVYRTQTLNDKSLTPGGVKSFLPDLIKYAENEANLSDFVTKSKSMSKADFDKLFFDFLKTDGSSWASSIKFKTKFTPMSQSLPEIIAWTFPYNHLQFESSIGYIKAMNEMFDIIDKHKDIITPSEGQTFAYSALYSNYVTIEIITRELVRNIILATVCIFVVTLLLLTDIVGSLMVLLSVIMTLIDVAGFMHFWGLSVDTVSAVLLTVSILELRQYKNGLVSVKRMFVLKFPPFFSHLHGKGK